MLTAFFPRHHAKYSLLNLVGNEVALKSFKQKLHTLGYVLRRLIYSCGDVKRKRMAEGPIRELLQVQT